MITGIFIENVPLIQTVVAWKEAVQKTFCVLDTGFTGDLQVTPKMAKELNLEITGVIKAQIANGDTVDVPVALAKSAMEGKISYVQVLISKSTPLAGISFLTKFSYKAIVDCKNKKVSLKRIL